MRSPWWTRIIGRSLVTRFVFMLGIATGIPVLALVVTVVSQSQATSLVVMAERAVAHRLQLDALLRRGFSLDEALVVLRKDPGIEAVYVLGDDGGRWIGQPVNEVEAMAGGILVDGHGLLHPVQGYYVARLVRRGPGGVLAVYEREPVRGGMWLLVGQVTGVGVASLIIVFFLALFLARRVLGPIDFFLRGMRKISAGEYPRAWVGEKAEAELGELQETFAQMVGYLEDNKRMEQVMANQEKMVTVGRLAAAVAHEIRNPLASISSLTQLIASSQAADGRIAEYTAVVLEEVDRLKKSINQLLAFAKPMPTTFTENRLTKILDDVILLVGFEAREAGLALETDFDREDEFPLLVDGNKLKQVFINLIRNAMQAVQAESGHLVVRLRFRREPDEAEIVFEDDGKGIPADILDEIFEPFISTHVSGSGLGLAISKRIIENHQGRIVVTSSPGKGAIFQVLLPRREPGQIECQEDGWRVEPREIR